MKKFHITPKQMCRLYIYISHHGNMKTTMLWKDGFGCVYETDNKLIFWSFKYKEEYKAYVVSSSHISVIEKWLERLLKKIKHVIGNDYRIES